MELGANSFHYNHIMPHISLLYDFLVTQALYRSGGKVDFPGEFIEGYAYLQSKFYGHLPGTIYGREARIVDADGAGGCRTTGSSTTFRPSTTTRCISFA